MKKIILLSTMTASLVLATNGDNLIGVGTKSRGMGGSGIAVSHCAESTLQNPALITCTRGTSVSFGGTVFMPDISAKMGEGASQDSEADINVIPAIAISHKINENWYAGIGMWGTAGMGVDYRDSPNGENMNMVSNLQLMQFAPSLAYSNNNFGVAVTPIIQYGALDINYKFAGNNVGDGIGQDLGFGYNIGGYYDVANGVTLGAVYKSSIDMEYKHQLSTATQPFVDAGIFPQAMSDHLEQPAEIGVGVGYEFDKKHTIAFDYKQIKWSDAKGYKDFGWEDQDVYAVGYQYKDAKWRARVGYNYAKSPVKEAQSGPAKIAPGSYDQAGGNALNQFNLLGFPATSETHFTLGGGYEFSDNFYVDMAYVYAPETTTTMKTIQGFDAQGNLLTGDSTVKHAESSISLQLSYRFF